LYPNVSTLYPSVPVYNRVLTDVGLVRSKKMLNNLTQFLLDLRENTKLLFCPELGVKLRTSGVNNYVTKAYDISPMLNDGIQTTALNQPFLSGNIAPNEKHAIKNPNGGGAYMTHTPISFSATDKWSVTFCHRNFYNASNSTNILFGIAGSGQIRYQGPSILFFNSKDEYAEFQNRVWRNIGKATFFTLVSNGLGNIILYENSVEKGTRQMDTSFIFSKMYSGVIGACGELIYHAIRNIALTPTQVAEEYTYLRGLFPEMESVQIGTQNWTTSNCEMTCTPQGNLVSEMQAATNVEKIINGGFDTDTDWDKGIGHIISDGLLNIDCLTGVYSRLPSVSNKLNCYYKITYTISNYYSGQIKVYVGNNSVSATVHNNNGTHTDYLLNSNATPGIYILALGPTKLSIDNVSVQEVGWSDSINLHNAIYAATTGTSEQKEYAAVKAAAMWCYYNNDPVLGSIYGKLYNWYAVRLLDMDINYYNVANPTATWGWRVPTSADYNTLATYLGGVSIAGGKMKKEGLVYWTSPNTGADNSSGFSSLESKARYNTGDFTNIPSFWTKTDYGLETAYFRRLYYNSADINEIGALKSFGAALRLIKA